MRRINQPGKVHLIARKKRYVISSYGASNTIKSTHTTPPKCLRTNSPTSTGKLIPVKFTFKRCNSTMDYSCFK